MHDMDGRWTFNETNDGLWSHEDFETKEEAIEEAKFYLCEDQQVMYIGKCRTVPLPTYVDVDDIFEQLDESYGEECFEYGEECFEYDDYLFDEVSREDKEWLENKLANLMLDFYKKAGIRSTQFTIVNMEKVTIEE